ncbi:MAG: hypothetical protein PWQ10_176 [Patescibacteria group bacterium]|nr:hypothetical protein [Patescibacteria group bacterium]
MKNIKKVLLVFFLFVGLFSIIPTNTYATNNLNIYLFWGNGCPHCAKEKSYLAETLPDYPDIVLNDYEIYNSQTNVRFMQEVADKLDISSSGVPLLIIGDKAFVGYSEETTGMAIKSRLDYCIKNICPDSVSAIVNSSVTNNKPSEAQAKTELDNEKNINLPFFGNIDALNFSLPLLTVIMGVLDGFNPCAMWTLMFLISLLLGMKNRRRMWALGVTFIVASATVYFLFMAAWLQLLLFLGFVIWVRLAIGLLATVGGTYNLLDYFKNRDKDSGCKVTGSEKRQLVFAKMKAIAHQNSLWLALGGIILLAFAVNLVELVCSAGFPAIFTQVLSLSNLPTWQYYSYILLYIFFFMLDDIIIFTIAMVTLKATGISTKYGKFSKLIGGILMLIIGLLLIFKPELLMFG